MNDDIQFVNYAWGPLLLHFKYPKEDITKLKRICKKAKGHKDWSGELAGVFPNGHQDLINPKDRLWFYKSIEPYFQTWAEMGVDFYGWKKLPMMKPQQVWVNHMTAGDFNPPHIHHGDITFVLFVISFSIFSIGMSPSSLISANFILIFFDFLRKCQGT